MHELMIDDSDVFLLKEESVEVEDELGPSFFVILRNFPLNAHALTVAHMNVLKEWVAPYLKRPAAIAEIYGMTDRSGSKQINYQVSAKRLAAVQNGLILYGPPVSRYRHAFCKALGEDFFAAKHDSDPGVQLFDDDRRDGSFRSVVLGLSPAPVGIPTRIFHATSARSVLSFGRLHQQTP
jgi:outer membrane protein OmpA-like peptidoglycan-associated protein